MQVDAATLEISMKNPQENTMKSTIAHPAIPLLSIYKEDPTFESTDTC